MADRDRRDKFAAKFIDVYGGVIQGISQGLNRKDSIALVRPDSDRLHELGVKIYEGGGNGGPGGAYAPPYTEEEHAVGLAEPIFDEIRMHHMGLPGYVYRFLATDRRATMDKVYEIARQTRLAGAKYLRTFMMNGDRSPSEKYMMDALAWVMVPVREGGKQVLKIDFTRRNDYYFECCGIIEQACKFWGIHHMPTYWMDRYNYDIFDRRYNLQGVDGYRSPEAQEIKCEFMHDYCDFQHIFRGDNYFHTGEFENEPFHHGNHRLGALIADQNLEMYRVVQAHGARIRDWMACSRFSEFSHANFVGEHRFESLDRTFGSEEFKSREIEAEWHGISTLETLLGDLLIGVRTGWPQLCYNEDGADHGSYLPIPWTNFRLANYQEKYDATYVGISECAARGKKFIETLFMMDCLAIDPADGIPKETYDLASMDFHRASAPKQVRLDMGIGG